MQQENPSFFAIIPADVRYADIIPHAKLLYGEITALANKTGSCYASNTYFSSLYGVSVRQVSKWIQELEKSGFIASKIEKGEGNRRYISLVTTYRTKVPDPIEQKFHTYRTKVPDPIEQKFQTYNNTFINTDINTDIILIKKEEEKPFRILKTEEVIEAINKAKIQSDFYYKVGDHDSLINSIADFLEHPSIQKKTLTVDNTERHFRKWLKPTYESEDDRKLLIQNYHKSIKKVPKMDYSVESDIEVQEKNKNAEKIKILHDYENKLTTEERKDIYDQAIQEILSQGRNRNMIGFDHLAKAKYNKILLSLCEKTKTSI